MCSTLTTGYGVGLFTRSSGDNEPAHYMLKIESFSLLSEAGSGIERFESDTFEATGYKWRLVLYPNGNKMDEGENHISLYLRIVDTESLPQGWEVNVYFKFYVYDHVQENYLTIQDPDGKRRRFHSMKLEWGVAKSLPLKMFKDTSSGYLFKDNCVFGVEVYVTPKFVVKENCLSMIKPPTTNKSYTWTIHNFSSIDEGKIYSEEFKVGKIKWKLELYPKGLGEGKGTHLSLFLSIADCESLPLHWRIYVNYKLRLQDQAGTDHFEKQSDGDWFSDSEKAWGFRKLILLSDLNDKAKSYVVNDKLIVEVEFAAVGVIRNFT